MMRMLLCHRLSAQVLEFSVSVIQLPVSQRSICFKVISATQCNARRAKNTTKKPRTTYYVGAYSRSRASLFSFAQLTKEPLSKEFAVYHLLLLHQLLKTCIQSKTINWILIGNVILACQIEENSSIWTNYSFFPSGPFFSENLTNEPF